MEEGAHHKYLGHAKVPAEALARLAVAVVDDVAAAAAVVAAPAAVDVAAALVLAVATELAAAGGAADGAVVAVDLVAAVEAQELEGFVAGHHCHQTWRWETEAG